MVLPAIEHANESLNWCFAAERGAVNDVAIICYNNLNFRGIPFTIGLYVEQQSDCACAYGYGQIIGYSPAYLPGQLAQMAGGRFELAMEPRVCAFS